MWIRVLSEWPGSPPCGAVIELPDPLARGQIQVGNAEPSNPSASSVLGPETAMLEPGERAIRPRGRPRKVRP